MSDAVHIEFSARPWLPTPDTISRVVLHRYSIPLAGVVEQHGVLYLYWCVTGHAAPENAWAYAQIDEATEERLATADGDSFDEELRAAAADRVCTFAVATDDKGVIASVVLSPPAGFDDAHQKGMAAIGDRFREMFDEYHALADRFPLLETAAHFGLSPTPAKARA
jgi:hypothetical protein